MAIVYRLCKVRRNATSIVTKLSTMRLRRLKVHFKRIVIIIACITMVFVLWVYWYNAKIYFESPETKFNKIVDRENEKEFDDNHHSDGGLNRRQIITSFAEDNCPTYKNDMINVHFILHTHDDPGWLKTSVQYYDQDVKILLNNVVDELAKNASRKIVYSEMYFFDKWWREINEEKRKLVKSFILNGQWEFVGGGWVQNDDALTHYTTSIDQLGYGLRKIKDLFGSKARPVTGWHIDNFGSSKEQSAIFAQSGFVAEVINRVSYFDRQERHQNSRMEFIWKGDEANSIFTHILYEHYDPPVGFRFENIFEHSQDDVTDENVGRKVKMLIEVVRQRRKSYPTDHLFLIMGNDFVFKDAKRWFQSLDKLISYGNSLHKIGSKVNFFYSTPSCYFKAVFQNMNKSALSVKTDDFFPYITDFSSVWTGYFTTRPIFKRLIRVTNSVLQTVEKFESTFSSNESRLQLNVMRENLFVTVHHDAITGTCKQAVADDYVRMLNLALQVGQNVTSYIVSNVVGRPVNVTTCPEMQRNYCPSSQMSNDFFILAFNGHSKVRVDYIRIPVNSSNLVILNGDKKLNYQILSIDNDEGQLSNSSRAPFELLAQIKILPLGYASYRINAQEGKPSTTPLSFTRVTEKEHMLENEYYKMIFGSNGFASKLINKRDNVTIKIEQIYLWYATYRSGAYMFRPGEMNLIPNATEIVLKSRKVGSLCQEVKQIFDQETTQIVRLCANKSYVEIEYTIGPVMAKFGKEIVTRFNTNIANHDKFYTDANGRQLIERKNTTIHGLDPESSLAAKFFPLTSAIVIKDRNVHMTLIPDRPIGGSSVENGTLEILLHRKLLSADQAGMPEMIDEKENDRPVVVRGKFWLTATAAAGDYPDDEHWRELAKEQFYSPFIVFTNTMLPEESLVDEVSLNGLHLLSLQQLDENSILIRLENYLPDKKRDVILKNIVKKKNLTNCRETFITGDQVKSIEGQIVSSATLKPLEIRTFICDTVK